MGFTRLARSVVLVVAVANGFGCAAWSHPADFAGLTLGEPGLAIARVSDDANAPTQMTLADAFHLALARNERVLIARQKVAEAEILSEATLNDVKPTITVTGTAGVERRRTTPTTMELLLAPSQILSAAARVQQPLYRRGFTASREVGADALDSARASLAREHEQLARDVTDAFVNVLLSRRLRDLAKDSVQRTQQQLLHALAREKAGQVLRNTTLLATVDGKRADRQLVIAERDVSIAEAAFRSLVGRTPPADLVLPPAPTAPNNDQAFALAQHRTDLRALQLDLAGARAAEVAAQGRRWWPRLDLVASVTGTEPEIGGLTNVPGTGKNLDWQVLGLVTIPILQNGREYTDVSLQENKTRVAALVLQQRLKIVGENVEVAQLRLSSADRVAELADQQLTVARDQYNLVDNQFRLGAITFLDVTTSEALLVEAENSLAVAKMDQVRALYDLLFAIGALDLDQPAPAPAPAPAAPAAKP